MQHRGLKFAIFLLLIFSVRGDDKKDTETNQHTNSTKINATVIPKHPVVNVLKSGLCTKCKCDIYLKELDCSNLGLTEWFKTDELDTLIYGNFKFDIINLSHNNLTNVPEFPNMDVKTLYLSFNKIEKIAKRAFKNMTYLTTLDLSHNKLTSENLKPDAFAGPYSATEYQPLEYLIDLNLAYNELHTLDIDIFDHLPHLKTLILCHNQFKIIDSSTIRAFSDLKSLKTLDLSYMQLSELPSDIFYTSKELHTVILTGNLFHKIPVNALKNAHNLLNLNFNENPISEFSGENVFPKMEHLKVLTISYMTELKKIGAGAFSELQNLTELQASNNELLEVIDKDAFKLVNSINSSIVSYPPVENLYLHNNNLKRLDESMLIRWDNFQEIDIRFNPWDCDDHNIWLVHNLIKYIHDYTEMLTRNVTCASPENVRNHLMYDVHIRQTSPVEEKAGGIFLGLCIGILVGVTMTFGSVLLYRRGCFGIFGRTPSLPYNRANFENNFDI